MVDVNEVIHMSYRQAETDPDPKMRTRFREMGDIIKEIKEMFEAVGRHP